MAVESPIRRLSPEFWAIVGSAVTLSMGFVGIAALVLTVTGWIREDMRSMDARIVSLDTKLVGLDTRLSGDIKVLANKVANVDKRLAVVESHVLDARRIEQPEPLDKT